jgi:hypothetical protein
LTPNDIARPLHFIFRLSFGPWHETCSYKERYDFFTDAEKFFIAEPNGAARPPAASLAE